MTEEPQKIRLWEEIGSERDSLLETDLADNLDDELDSEEYSSSDDDGFDAFEDDISWSEIDPPETEFDIKSKFQGPSHELKNCPPRNSSPISYFYLFLTPAIWIRMTKNTNMYANQMIQDLKLCGKELDNPIQTILKDWTDVSVSEMKLYIALLMSTSLSSTAKMKQFWDNTGFYSTSFFCKNMSYERFNAISTLFRLEWRKQEKRNGEPGYNCFCRISPLINELNSSFKMYFIPQQDIAIDESRVAFTNNSPVVRYLPNRKRAVCGIKRLDVCDNKSGYILHTALYMVNHNLKVSVEEFNNKFMLEVLSETNLLNKSYNLFLENPYCFCNLSISEKLLAHNTYFTAFGVCKVEQWTPLTEIIPKIEKTSRGEPVHFINNNTYYAAYRTTYERKYCISNINYTDEELISGKLDEKRKRKHYIPKRIMWVNGYVHDSNMMGFLSCTRTTRNYWRYLFYYLLDICTLNAFILHSMNSDKKLIRKDFVQQIINKLIKEGKGHLNPESTETDDESAASEDEDFSWIYE